jgi:CheY-like chemotaxis protein
MRQHQRKYPRLSIGHSDSCHKKGTAMLNKKHKILVVDDQQAIVSARATILESQGYETASAFSGEEAVQVAYSFHPDCIVSDITMGR